MPSTPFLKNMAIASALWVVFLLAWIALRQAH